MKSINVDLNERVTLMHIGVPAKSRFYASRIHALTSSRCELVAVDRGSTVFKLLSLFRKTFVVSI